MFKYKQWGNFWQVSHSQYPGFIWYMNNGQCNPKRALNCLELYKTSKGLK